MYVTMLVAIPYALLLVASASAAAAADPSEASSTSSSASGGSMGLPDSLPWGDLTSKLSPNASLISVSHADYMEDCFPEFTDFEESERTNYQLINQPSGLCLPHLFCGWEMCYPRPSTNGHANQTYNDWILEAALPFLLGMETPELFDPANPISFLNDESNPSLNLPSMVLFPVVASDVVAAILFAKAHNVEISVKNSGHHYAGASQKKGTLLLNMNRYTQYSPTGIVDCDVSMMLDGSIAADLSVQPCALSLAKDKSAYIRVGGGENWNKVYRSVKIANEAQEQEGGEYTYHVVGGNAGSVSPFGWTFLGGLSGSSGGRKYGFGVDQVLQIEMVLPNGHHVRFGPTKWEDASADGYSVPKTIGVSGLCRSNPEEQDEEKWEWDSCPDGFGIDFNDLWYAVRGGVELHEYTTFELYGFGDGVTGDLGVEPTEECAALMPTLTPLLTEFMNTYIMVPSLVGVSEDHSNACGNPGGLRLFCFGDEDVDNAWARFLVKKNVTDIPEGNCLLKIASVAGFKDHADYAIRAGASNPRLEGRAYDRPQPELTTLNGGLTFNVLFPSAWIEQSEDNLKIALEWMGSNGYHAFGGATHTANDQANSLSSAHRDAGVMVFAPIDLIFDLNLFPKMFDFSDKTNFPPVFGANHASVLSGGPSKDDWSKRCPIEWTFEKRAKGCISAQESIYGTKFLKRLEAIKEVVDPNYMFDCNNCVGNNRPNAKPVQEKDDSVVAQSADEQTSGAFSVGEKLSVIVSVIGWFGFQFML